MAADSRAGVLRSPGAVAEDRRVRKLGAAVHRYTAWRCRVRVTSSTDMIPGHEVREGALQQGLVGTVADLDDLEDGVGEPGGVAAVDRRGGFGQPAREVPADIRSSQACATRAAIDPSALAM